MEPAKCPQNYLQGDSLVLIFHAKYHDNPLGNA